MQQLIEAIYWLSLATWFGAVLFSAVVPPIVVRVVRHHDPTLPRVLSVNLNMQHSSILAGAIVSDLLQIQFRIQMICAILLGPSLLAKWYWISKDGLNILLPILVSVLYIFAVIFLTYGWRYVWPKVVSHRQTYIDNADDPDVANPALDQYERYSNECLSIIRNLLFIMAGMIVFSAVFNPAFLPIKLI